MSTYPLLKFNVAFIVASISGFIEVFYIKRYLGVDIFNPLIVVTVY